MPVMEKRKIVLPPEALNMPEVEYPQEVIDRLEAMREITNARIAMGEKLKTVREYAAERRKGTT